MGEIEKKLVQKYISRYYPIIMVKIKKRFKRGVEIIQTEGGVTNIHKLQLNSNKDSKIIKEHIIKDVSLVFGLNENKIKNLITDYVYRY